MIELTLATVSATVMVTRSVAMEVLVDVTMAVVGIVTASVAVTIRVEVYLKALARDVTVSVTTAVDCSQVATRNALLDMTDRQDSVDAAGRLEHEEGFGPHVTVEGTDGTETDELMA